MKKGAYFDIKIKDDLVYKILINKKGGSKYPQYIFFLQKINTLIEYLGDYVVDTKIIKDKQKISLIQEKVVGQDLFNYLKTCNIPNNFSDFISRMKKLYIETGILPDLLNDENILVNKNNEIVIVDVWPLFFEERIKEGDINQESYDENIEKFNYLNNLI